MPENCLFRPLGGFCTQTSRRWGLWAHHYPKAVITDTLLLKSGGITAPMLYQTDIFNQSMVEALRDCTAIAFKVLFSPEYVKESLTFKSAVTLCQRSFLSIQRCIACPFYWNRTFLFPFYSPFKNFPCTYLSHKVLRRRSLEISCCHSAVWKKPFTLSSAKVRM